MHDKILERGRHTCSLRNACRKALSAAIILLAALPATAQKYPNGLAVESVDPKTDSIVIAQMKDKLDSIRINERRPTVALVLSGGGAKGAAHIGVMKVLKEIDLPVDLVCGTSMGGLVGGLYAMGYSPEFLDSLIRNQNWDVTLTDKIDQKYFPYSTKKYKGKFLVSIPYHYEKDAFETRILEQEKYSDRDGHLRVGADEVDMSTQLGVNSLASSLPSGYVYGFNVNNLISSLSVGYQDSISFKDLPIPYFAVASDIVSCKAKNWGSGSVKSAMRSTMSIPGMFDPVRTQGMILVDGGTRNNFPVDIARAMGADFVVGVEISDAAPGYSQVNNLGNILMQFIKMLGKDALDKNIPEVDVFIKPDLKGYNMLSFSTENIDDIINKGYVAAKAREKELRAIKTYMKGAHQHLNGKPATDISATPVKVEEIVFDGMKKNESRMLERKIDIKDGDRITSKDIDKAMSRIQATEAFESVTYTLLGSEEPYRLVFDCAKAPVHQIGLGVRADSEELVSLLFNVGLNAHKLMGLKMDFTGKLGNNKYADLRFALDIPNIPTLNLEGIVSDNMGRLFQPGDNKNYFPTYSSHKEMLYLSNIRWTAIDIQAGVRNQYYSIPESAFTDAISSSNPAHDFNADFIGAFVKGGAYTLDRNYYPRKGMDFHFNYGLDVIQAGVSDFSPTQTLAADFKFVIPLGRFIAIIPDLHYRGVMDMTWDARDSWSLFHGNYVGGSVSDRFIENQVPFVGFNGVYNAMDQLAVANLDLRVKTGKNLYFSLLGGYMRQSPTLKDFISDVKPTCWGAGIELGYNTAIGPIKGNLHWSDLTRRYEGYLSVGFDF